MAKNSNYRPAFAPPVDDKQVPVTDERLPAIGDEPDDMVSGVGGMLDELRSLGGEAGLNVYVMPRPGSGVRTKTFIMNCGLNDYSLGELLTLIQNGHGAGDYEICGTLDGKIRARRRVTIGEPVIKVEAEKSSIDTMKPLMEFFEQSLRRQTESTNAILAQLVNQVQRPPVDPLEMQRQTLETISTMRNLFAPPAVAAPVKEGSMIQQLKELMELRELVRGDKDPGESSTFDSMLEMGKTFLPQLAAMSAPPAATSTSQSIKKPSSTDTKKVSLSSLVPSTVNVETNAMLNLKSDLKRLISAAERGADTDLYADLIADSFPAELVASFISSPDAVDRLALFAPGVKLHREWFEKLRSSLKELLSDDAATDTREWDENDGGTKGDTLGVSGNACDVARDEPVSGSGEDKP